MQTGFACVYVDEGKLEDKEIICFPRNSISLFVQEIEEPRLAAYSMPFGIVQVIDEKDTKNRITS